MGRGGRGGGRIRGVGLGGQGRREQRSEVFVKNIKKYGGVRSGGGVGRGLGRGEVCWMGGQGGCERRIEVFVKIKKKCLFFFFGGGVGDGSGSGLGVRVDVIEELKFLRKFKIFFYLFFFFFFFWGGGVGVGFGGEGGCERRIEVFAKIQKKNCGGVGVGLEGVRLDVNVELKFL